jgi:hypothetical protein
MTHRTTSYNEISSLSEYEMKYPNASVILDLGEKFRDLPASRWGKKHLIAHRLIQQEGGRILPILRKATPKLKDLKHCDEWGDIKRLIDGPEGGDLL